MDCFIPLAVAETESQVFSSSMESREQCSMFPIVGQFAMSLRSALSPTPRVNYSHVGCCVACSWRSSRSIRRESDSWPVLDKRTALYKISTGEVIHILPVGTSYYGVPSCALSFQSARNYNALRQAWQFDLHLLGFGETTAQGERTLVVLELSGHWSKDSFGGQ